MTERVLIDCDPGHDDAVALLLAAQADEIDLVSVTTVAGNGSLERSTENALKVLTLAGRTDIPVAAGMDRPLLREPVTASEVHGETGLDGTELDDPAFETEDTHGVDQLIETLRASDEQATLVPIGPLTNVAMALRKAPDLTESIERIVLMGGALAEGNVTPVAEFNVYADPEAASIVFQADVEITMVGLDATRQARYGADRFDEMRSLNNRVGDIVAELFEFYLEFHADAYGWDGVPIHDACAVAEVIEPGIVESQRMRVDVEVSKSHSYGQTVCDRQGSWTRTDHADDPNADVALSVDKERFFDLLLSELGRY